jgi:hypothetical protein
MTDQLSREIADGLRRIGTGDPPDGLAAAALRGADRARRARVAGTFVAVVAVIAVALGVLTAATPRQRSQPATRPGGAHLVISGFGCTTVRGYSQVLDPAHGGYRKVPYCLDGISPDGRRAIVSDLNGINNAIREGVLSTTTGKIRWYPERIGIGATWSPDGRTLLMPVSTDGASPSVMVLDPETGRGHKIDLSARTDKVVWLPNGHLLATAQCGCVDPAVYEIALTGELIRQYPKAPRHPWPAGLYAGTVSPDGRYLVESSEAQGGGFVTALLLDAAGAYAVGHIDLYSYSVVGWYDATRLLVRERADGGRRLIQLGVMDLGGTITPLPARDLGFDAGDQSDSTVFIGTATDATRDVAF